MRIYNENQIANKLVANAQIMTLEIDENMVNEVLELLEKDYNSMDEFFWALNKSYILSDGQKGGIVSHIAMIHKNDGNFIIELLSAQNAKIYMKYIIIGLGSMIFAEIVQNYFLQKKKD